MPKARSCPQCGCEVPPPSGRGRPRVFCSRRCNSAAHRDSSTKTCSDPDCARPVRAKGVCSMHRKRQVERPKDRLTEKRRASLRKSTSMRRARERGADREDVDRDVVAERDGWKCWLCEKRIDPSLRYPDQMSASLDHVVPLSLNGSHTYANCRIAHLTCNVRRSNRVTDIQLLLVG